MTLSMTPRGSKVSILKIKGKDDTKRFLANLGFVEGEKVSVVSEIDGNMIINVKDARIALSQSMTNRIIVMEG